jgi:hypothetical protein
MANILLDSDEDVVASLGNRWPMYCQKVKKKRGCLLRKTLGTILEILVKHGGLLWQTRGKILAQSVELMPACCPV